MKQVPRRRSSGAVCRKMICVRQDAAGNAVLPLRDYWIMTFAVTARFCAARNSFGFSAIFGMPSASR